MLVEKFCYHLGAVVADIVLVSVTPTTSALRKFSTFATVHRLNNKTVDTISRNLLDCLPIIEP
jgi:hypothetical protein